MKKLLVALWLLFFVGCGFAATSNTMTAEKIKFRLDDSVLIYVDGDNVLQAVDSTGAVSPLRSASGTAPVDAEYIVSALDPTLINERVLQGTANQAIVTFGAGTATISTPQDLHSGASPTFGGLSLSGDADLNGNDVIDVLSVNATGDAFTLKDSAGNNFLDKSGSISGNAGLLKGGDPGSAGNGTYWEVKDSTKRFSVYANGSEQFFVEGTVPYASFNHVLVANDSGGSENDFRWESDTESHAVNFDATGSGYIGIGGSPTAGGAGLLQIIGTAVDREQLMIRAHPTQSDDIVLITASDGVTKLFSIDSTGAVFAPTLDTGFGAKELGQSNRTTDDMTFNRLTVDGSDDVVRLIVQGHSTQTADHLVIENSAGTDILTVDQFGRTTVNEWQNGGGDFIWHDEDSVAVTFDADGDVEFNLSAGNFIVTGDSVFQTADSLTVDGKISAEDSGGVGLADDTGTIGVWVEDGAQVGVGTKTPSAELHIDKSSGIPVFRIESGDNYVVLNLINKNSGYATSGWGIYAGFPTGGDWTVRENGVANRLTIAKTTGLVTAPGVYSQTTGSGANVNVDSSGNLKRSTSSRKYKKNIEDLDNSSSSRIYLLRPRKNDRMDGSLIGERSLIAEEVFEVMPEFVIEGVDEVTSYVETVVFQDDGTSIVLKEKIKTFVPNGKPDAVDYMKMVVPLLHQVQRQHARILTQKNINETQETLISDLGSRVTELEKQVINLKAVRR